MKKSFKFLGVMLAVLLTTGCVKMEIGMDINKDKSMNLVITEAFNKTLLEQSEEEIFSVDQVKEVEKQGFKAKEYSDGSMSGYTFTKAIDNIDTVSSDKEVTGNIGVSLESSKEASDKLFTIKKGFFKNTYMAKLTSSDSKQIENQISGSTNGSDITTNNGLTADNTIDGNMPTDDSVTSNSDIDYSAMMNGMDMNFTVNLPYKAKSNNATSVDNDGKKLKWDLLKFKEDNIKFEFELYNMTNIYITAGAALLLLIIVIALIVSKKKHKKTPVTGPKVEAVTSINPEAPMISAATPEAPTINVPETIAPSENLVKPVTPVSTSTPTVEPNPQRPTVNVPETVVAQTPVNNPQVSNTQNLQGIVQTPTQTSAVGNFEEPVKPEIETLDIVPAKEVSIEQNLNQQTDNQASNLDIFTVSPEQNQDINKPI